jgi:ABC-type branched-subunit amino acid transport system ATPase component
MEPALDVAVPLRVGRADEVVVDVRDVRIAFGGVHAVAGVDLHVKAGTIHALVGPNGAGKTTLLNIVSGVYRPDGGTVTVSGTDVTGLRADRIRALGVARTFQVPNLFDDQTVIGNVVRGMSVHLRQNLFAAALATPGVRRQEREARARAHVILAFLGLEEDAERRAAELSYGRRRAVEIGMALACEPAALLLDEPAAGLNRTEEVEFAQILLRLRDAGLAMLLVEHHMGLVADVSSVVTCMNEGTVIFHGSAEELAQDPTVRKAYLGRDAAIEASTGGVDHE